MSSFDCTAIGKPQSAIGNEMAIHLVIHGHFYQPPRENPWTGEIERQESAAPFHDWNARIAAECYAPNARSRVLDAQGRIRDIVNNYERIRPLSSRLRFAPRSKADRSS